MSKVAIVECRSYERDVVAGSVDAAINLLGGIEQFVYPGCKVLLKPNLCLPVSPEKNLTTHPEIVRRVAWLCRENAANVTIGDSPVGKTDKEHTASLWELTGMKKAALAAGCRMSNLNGAMEIFNRDISGKSYKILISDEVFKMDSIINIPKFKTHSLMTFSGAVKNLFGLLPENIKKWLHREMPGKDEFAAVLADIYAITRPGLHIMDAVWGIEGEGPGAKGEQRKIGLILASTDAVALDSVAARLMNLQSDEVQTNRIGNRRGLGESNLNHIEIVGEPLLKYIMEDYKLPLTHRYTKELTRKIFGMETLCLSIDDAKCRKCRLCLLNCPGKAIAHEGSSLVIHKKNCVSCLICHEICPEGAIDFEGITYIERLKRR